MGVRGQAIRMSSRAVLLGLILALALPWEAHPASRPFHQGRIRATTSACAAACRREIQAGAPATGFTPRSPVANTDNVDRALPEALTKCACYDALSALGAVSNGGRVALTPSIVQIEPSIQDGTKPQPLGLKVQTTFSIRFDVAMDMSIPADSVVTLEGCGITPVSTLRWMDAQTIQGEYRTGDTASTAVTLTVHAGEARSKPGGLKLDGNDAGKQSFDGAQAPSGDDFVWKFPCIEPKITRATFAVSGAQLHYTFAVPDNACVYRLQDFTLNWSATWAPMPPLPLKTGSQAEILPSGSGGTLGGTEDGTGTTNKVSTCPNSSIAPTCSASLSVVPRGASPRIWVTDDQGTGANRVWTVHLQFIWVFPTYYDPSGSVGPTPPSPQRLPMASWITASPRPR
jgi:hypothetical protein